MRRFLALSSATLSSILFAGLFAVSSANAQTPPPIQITDKVYSQANPPTGEVVDRTTSWLSHAWDKYYYPDLLSTVQASFNAAIDNGSWGLLARTGKIGGQVYHYYSFFWVNSRDCNTQLKYADYGSSQQYYLENTSTDDKCRWRVVSPSGPDNDMYGYSMSGRFMDLSSNDVTHDIKLVFYAGDYTLDPSASHLTDPLPKDLSPAITPDFLPSISFWVEDKELTVQSNVDIEDLLKYDIKSCRFQIPNNIFGDNFNEYTYNCQTMPKVTHEFDEYSSYNIHHILTDSKGYEYTLSSVININGSTYSGTLGEKPKYEDCDLLDMLCHFRNAGTFLSQIFAYLFVPDFSRLSESFLDLTDRFKSSLGLFWAPFDMFIQTFQVLTGNSPNPTGYYCSLGDWQMFGRGQSAQIELCRWRDQLPSLWSTMQLAIQASISISMLYVFWSLFRTDILGLSKRDNDEEDSSSDEVEEVRWRDDRTGDTGPWERKRR